MSISWLGMVVWCLMKPAFGGDPLMKNNQRENECVSHTKQYVFLCFYGFSMVKDGCVR